MGQVYSYQAIAAPSEGNFQDSGSKFLSYAFPCDTRSDVESRLTEVKALHPRARHHCYAYRILEHEETTEYASDAGEPSGSAGAPILGELRRQELLNICVIVVRYFGGTKLGIPGLIHAYRETASRALDASNVITSIRKVRYQIEMPQALQPMFYDACKLMDLAILSTHYSAAFTAQFELPMERAAQHLKEFISRMTAKTGDIELLMQHYGITLFRVEE